MANTQAGHAGGIAENCSGNIRGLNWKLLSELSLIGKGCSNDEEFGERDPGPTGLFPSRVLSAVIVCSSGKFSILLIEKDPLDCERLGDGASKLASELTAAILILSDAL